MKQKIKLVNLIALVLCGLMLIAAVVSVVVTLSGRETNESMTNEQFLEEYTYRNTKGAGGVTGIGDPQVFYDDVNGKWRMTCTYDGMSFKLFTSDDLTAWDSGKTIFTKDMVDWGVYDSSIGAYGLWGAEIHRRGDTYYLYYSIWAKDAEGNATSPRIGVATSSTVDGMYTDKGSPLFDYGYSAIDNHLFTDDDGKNYFYYVRDAYDNVVDGVHESHIYVVPMNDDLMSVADSSQAVCLLKPEFGWERRSGGGTWAWVEGCWMQKMNGKYYLFYSANKYNTRDYAIGYAVSDSPTGPFVKNPEPLLDTCADELVSPGNNSFFSSKDGKELFTAYHMLTTPDTPSGNRYLNIDRIGLRSDGTVYINAPTITSQPLPSGEKEGHTLLSDEARVVAGGTADGYDVSAVNDGEVAVLVDHATREWVSSQAPDQATLRLEWDGKVTINSVFLYNSIVRDHRSRKVTLRFSDGTTVEGVRLGEFGGEAGIVNLNGVRAEWMEIVVSEKGFGQTAFALSEVMVFGSK